MKVNIEKNNSVKNITFEGKMSVLDLLKLLNIHSETVLVVRNGEILNDDELVSDDDELTLLSVVSGG